MLVIVMDLAITSFLVQQNQTFKLTAKTIYATRRPNKINLAKGKFKMCIKSFQYAQAL